MLPSPSLFINVERLNLTIVQPMPLSPDVELKSSNAETNIPNNAVVREYQTLGGGKKLTQEEMLAELATLGEGWRLETPHELFSQVDYGHKNQHGAYTRDGTLQADCYWTSQPSTWYEGGRVVVGFSLGLVHYYLRSLRAFARAVRVSGQ